MSLNSGQLTIIVVCATIQIVLGHGSVLDPVCRQSRWRRDDKAPINYDDNEVFCGGLTTQFQKNGGKCGVCGDDHSAATPRDNELGGTFGQGDVVGSFVAGAQMPVNVLLTANHKGHFVFQLCNLDDNGGIEDEQCFERNPLQLSNGEGRFRLPSDEAGEFEVILQLPGDMRCEHCVLRWTYVAGNNWGRCEDGTFALGCGNQEHYRSCSDIEVK